MLLLNKQRGIGLGWWWGGGGGGGGEVAVTPYNLVTRADGFFRISTETALSTEMEPIHTENDPTYTGIEGIYCLTESKVDGF